MTARAFLLLFGRRSMANCVYFRCIYRHIVDLDPGGTCAGVISFITTRIAYNIGQNAIIKDDKLTTVLFIVLQFWTECTIFAILVHERDNLTYLCMPTM